MKNTILCNTSELSQVKQISLKTIVCLYTNMCGAL